MENNSLGLKTLDILNDFYTPFYNNSDDSTNIKIAHGFSYHQGPEWVWVYGYFLKALIEIKKGDPNFKNEVIMSYLAPHK